MKQSAATRVTVPVRITPIQGGASKDAGLLSGVRALQIDDTQARLLIQGVERVVKVGDRIGADIVKSIAPGRVVLTRPTAASGVDGESLVILRFDPQGRTQVLVVSSRDTTSRTPGTVK